MKRLAILFFLCLCLTSIAQERSLAFVIKRTDWQAIPTAKKLQGEAILKKCTNAPIPMKLNWLLRKKTNHSVIYGFAVYGKDAWVLKQKEHISDAKIQQIKDIWDSYGGILQWTTDFWQDVDDAGLEMIPSIIEEE